MRFPLPSDVLDIVTAIDRAGGRALVVGGFVRDHLLRIETKDIDIEVFGLPIDGLESTLASFGEVITVGRAFGVLRLKHLDVDFSIPRRDNKIGKGHRDFRVEFDPNLSFADAARRRDLTINALGYDPLTDEILDEHEGRDDLEARRLRAVDETTFPEDPLRALRVAQFLARFDMQPDETLTRLCRDSDLADLSAERIHDELIKLMLKAPRPSLGWEFLRTTDLIRFFPEAEALIDVPQDPEWHPEGTVWEHTLMVIDEAAKLRVGQLPDDVILMFAALAHDFGKPATTFTDDDGRIRSPNHEDEGVAPTRAFMERLRFAHDIIDAVAVITRYHLAPAMFPLGGAKPKAYRRLARNLAAGGTTMEMLARVARADHFGRTTPDALARDFSTGDAFLAAAADLHIEGESPKDVVQGRHLIARGLQPGPLFKEILDRCRDYQDETGETDAEAILDALEIG